MSASDIPPVSITTTDTTQIGAGDQVRVAMDRGEEFGGARLMISDMRVVFLLLNEARYRLIARLFGVSRDESFLVTLIAIAVVAKALRDKAPSIPAPYTPSVADAAIGAAVLSETGHGVGGDESRGIPFFVPLVAFAMVAKYHPVLRGARGSLRGVKASSRKVRAALRTRYGG